MFISQVIFESEKENMEIMKQIMLKKETSTENVAGLLSCECWWKEGNTVGFAFVTKWNSKEDFQKWLKDSHKDGHQKGKQNIQIKKTVYQFDYIDTIL
ncbi:MAG: hypothetical protein ACK5LC_05215 [Coprobacillaceae bacterium]